MTLFLWLVSGTLRDAERRELEYSKGQISFENEIACEYSADALMDEIVREFRKGVTQRDGVPADKPLEELLLSKRLIKRMRESFFSQKERCFLWGKTRAHIWPGPTFVWRTAPSSQSNDGEGWHRCFAVKPLGRIGSESDAFQIKVFSQYAKPSDRIKAAFGANYDRLVALKNRYDPTNLFRHNQNIKPTL